MSDHPTANAAYGAVLHHERQALALRAQGKSGRQGAAEEQAYAVNSLIISRALLAGMSFHMEAHHADA